MRAPQPTPATAGPIPPGVARTAAPLAPRAFTVRGVRVETHDTVTLALEPADGVPLPFAAGQFTMVGVLGAGEAPISISGDPAGGLLQQTVRDAGGVTHALAYAAPGDMVTMRGPYGTGWDVPDGKGGDVLLIAGGIGLAPLRPALLQILADRRAYRRVTLLYGARAPGERLFTREYSAWASEGGIAVEVTVDRADPGWRGNVGVVTHLLTAARFHPAETLALVCGPEVMMRFVATALTDAGVPGAAIRVSLERSMECGVGLCGHCQLRELFICTDGPVLPYDRVAGLLAVREY